MKQLVNSRKGQKGASMVEYAILLSLLLLFILAGIRAVGEKTSDKFNEYVTLTNQ